MTAIQKLVFFSTICLIGFVAMTEDCAAQPDGRRAMMDSTMIKAQVDSLAIKLALSEEQKQKVQAIYLTNANEMKKAFENNQGDRRSMRDTMMKLRDKQDNEVTAVLNDKQKEEYDKLMEKEREARRQRFMQRRGSGRF